MNVHQTSVKTLYRFIILRSKKGVAQGSLVLLLIVNKFSYLAL